MIFYDAITRFGVEKIFQIDVTFQSIQETTKKVLDGIKGKIKSEEVDWLTAATEKNNLKEFFAY